MPKRGSDAGNAVPPTPAKLPPSRYSRALLDETIALWQPHYARRLSDEDARDIIDNLSEYFRILLKWRAAGQTNGDQIQQGLDRTAH